jgi:hypothetical protein
MLVLLLVAEISFLWVSAKLYYTGHVARQSSVRRDDTSLGECEGNIVGKDMVGLGGKSL